MLTMLTDIPAYNPEKVSGITEEEYIAVVGNIQREVSQAIELFDGYWRTSNTLLFDMSMEALARAYCYTKALADTFSDDDLWERIVNRAVFSYELSAVMLGR